MYKRLEFDYTLIIQWNFKYQTYSLFVISNYKFWNEWLIEGKFGDLLEVNGVGGVDGKWYCYWCFWSVVNGCRCWFFGFWFSLLIVEPDMCWWFLCSCVSPPDYVLISRNIYYLTKKSFINDIFFNLLPMYNTLSCSVTIHNKQ